MEFEVGQTVCVVTQSGWGKRRKPRIDQVKIAKVGTKWVYLEGHYGRFHAKEMWIDAGQYISNGSVYLTEYDYQKSVELGTAWGALKQKMRDCHQRPEHLTADRINRIADDLFPTVRAEQVDQ